MKSAGTASSFCAASDRSVLSDVEAIAVGCCWEPLRCWHADLTDGEQQGNEKQEGIKGRLFRFCFFRVGLQPMASTGGSASGSGSAKIPKSFKCVFIPADVRSVRFFPIPRPRHIFVSFSITPRFSSRPNKTQPADGGESGADRERGQVHPGDDRLCAQLVPEGRQGAQGGGKQGGSRTAATGAARADRQNGTPRKGEKKPGEF